MCVTNFTYILLENQVHPALCVWCLQKVSSKVNFLQSIFAAFCDLLGYMKILMTDIPKTPCQSLKETSVTIFIEAFIIACDSTAQELAAKIH